MPPESIDNVFALLAGKGQAGTPSEPPGPPDGGAPAPAKGKGGGKPIDWGRYNALLHGFALIYGTDTVWDAENRLIMKIANMAHAHGSDMVRMWKGSPQRWTVMPQDVVFDPSLPIDGSDVEEGDMPSRVNLFGGIAMQPAASVTEDDVRPMLKLVRHLTSRSGETADESDEILHYLMCWFAYPLQRLGTKLRTAVIMHGDEGAGKNILFEVALDIYGEYGALVGQDELEDKFNDWRSRKMLVVGDEVSSRQELVHNKNRLKALITSPKVQINPKNLPRREEANFINIGFLSNELQPLVLDNTDRRYLVVYTPPPLGVEFYRELGKWRSEGGARAWYRYLLDYPCADFNPYAPAPITRAKTDLIELNRTTAERFWVEWHEGSLELPYWTCTVAQAYRAYLVYCRRVGERFPDKQPMFTRRVLRISEQCGAPTRVKVMKIDHDVGTGARYQKATRVLLVTEPPEEAQGQWASDVQRSFERELWRYVGDPRSPGDGDASEEGG